MQKAPLPPRTRKSVSFVVNKPIIVAPRRNFLQQSNVGDTSQRNRQQIFEMLIKGVTNPPPGVSLEALEA
jgi:hypothetical protein